MKLLGTVGGKRFEAKVEGGEVKLQGLTLTQDQLNALSTQLQKTSGVREFRIRAVVDGKPMIAKFENGQLRTEMRRPDRVERGDRSDRTDRAERADRVERPERSGKSPLRPDIRHHRNVKNLVQETMGLLRSLPQRSARGEGPGLEANGAIVVTHDNVDRTAAALVTVTPAPQVGDPIHYDSFLRRLCDSDTHRWSVGRSSD